MGCTICIWGHFLKCLKITSSDLTGAVLNSIQWENMSLSFQFFFYYSDMNHTVQQTFTKITLYKDTETPFWAYKSLLYVLLRGNNIITSAKEVMFSPGFVCGFVSLFVNKITQKLMDRF